MEYVDQLETPLGKLLIRATDKGVTHVLYDQQYSKQRPNQHTETCKQQLTEYFQGLRKIFSVNLDLSGTLFQKQVWSHLQAIEYGCVVSYQDIAICIGNPKAVRAVGTTNGRNPINLIIPCHRVIGKNGALTGYRGGLQRKQWLLEREGVCL